MNRKMMTVYTAALLGGLISLPNFLQANLKAIQYERSFHQSEMIQLQLRILASNIERVYIAKLNTGTLRKILGINAKKVLAWNSAGRRLYPSIKAARQDGFFVWQFSPSSAVVALLDEQLKAQGEKGYSDELLYIMWDGIQSAEDERIPEETSDQTDGCE